MTSICDKLQLISIVALLFSFVVAQSSWNLSSNNTDLAKTSLSNQLLQLKEPLDPDQDWIQASNDLRSQISKYAQKIENFSDTEGNQQEAQNAESACNIIAVLFPGIVVAPGNSNYTSEQDVNWSETCQLPASCFIRLQNTFQVSATLKVITYVQSMFAVRSGGHNPNPGFGSVNQTGVLLDLRGLDSVTLQDNGILRTGPGRTWGSVYNFLDPYNVSVQGGRSNGVGVGGYILGGGMVFFPNLLGLGVDSVKNVEIVLGSSEVINANASSHPDLFQSIKGGGPNFGIITRFDILTHPLHHVWYSLNVYSAANYNAILNATIQVQAAMDKDPKLGFFLNVNPTMIIAGFLYADWASKPKGFESFDSLTPLSAFIPETNGTMSSLGNAIEIGGNPARREPYAVSHEIDLDLYLDIHERYLLIISTLNQTSANLAYTIQPLSESGVNAGINSGENSLGLKPISQTWHASLVEWTSDEDDADAHKAVNLLGSDVQSLASKRGKLLDFQFMNDASFTQNPLKSYGQANMARLQGTRLAYDPDEVFQKLQNSGFLLS